jgi:hypothetical protein
MRPAGNAGLLECRMASGNIQLQCDIPVRDLLCGAIRDYAHAAYPVGGSDCAQVARYTLLELAARIEQGISPDTGSVQVSRRPRAMVKAALDYYFDRLDQQTGTASLQQRALLESLLKESPVNVADLDRARAIDAQA